ncbi:MAG: hypothetical protein DRZ79_05950 [Candidatus Cloacimonadota bacterium]|nr:MAG: hypothetical protein DRZ79_05950 [Candidatus Cloacimonadota bacterium]
MTKKKSKNEQPKTGPIISGLISMFFEVMKHFIKDFENMRKVKKIDNWGDKFSNMEHMLIRLEDKIQENRRQIDDLKNRILWGNIVIIVLLLVVIFQSIR